MKSFLSSAHYSALLQRKAAEIVVARDVRPEVKQYAQDMLSFRSAQLQRLAAVAAENKAALPGGLTFEQQVLIDNLTPLEFLALARRYAELQLRALEQEIGAYETAQSQNTALTPFIVEFLPLLRQRLDGIGSVLKAVDP